MTFSTEFHSPVGSLTLEGDDTSLTRLGFGAPGTPQGDARAIASAAIKLEQYFAGERTSFDLDIALDGTPFERRVWEAVSAIPYGSTATYAEIAERIGSPNPRPRGGAPDGGHPPAPS